MNIESIEVDSLPSQLHHIKSLHQKRLYKTAFDFAFEHWGPMHKWQRLQQMVVGSRVLMALGIRRSAYALRYRMYRKYPKKQEVLHYYLSTIIDRKGPLKGFELIQQHGKLEHAKPKVQVDWLVRSAQVYEYYRDWQTAEQLVEEALILSPNNPWALIQKACICENRDQYDLGLTLLEPLVKKGMPSATYYAAHLNNITGDTPAAIELLQAILYKVESISLALQLYGYYQQLQQPENAQVCVDLAQSLIPTPFKGRADDFSVAEFELAYMRSDYCNAEKALTNIKSPYFKRIRENIIAAPDNAQRKQLNVPFVRQHHKTCSPATLSAICQYWQNQAKHLDIVEDICYDGTPNHAERRWCQEQGWVTREFELDFSTAQQLIDRGVPFTLSTVDPGSAHLQAVVGYDTRKGVYLIRDPYFPNIQEFLCREFGENYLSSGPRCLAFVPDDKRHLFDNITLPGAELYDLNYQLNDFLEKHRRSEAEHVLTQMQSTAPNHRITLLAMRSLARYNNDNLQELAIIEKLLENFSDDLNLQSSKGYLLGRQGRYEEQLQFLRSCTQHAYPHPYIVVSLIDCLRRDNRLAAQAEDLIKYVLYRQPTNAAILWEWASLLWDQEKYQEALVFYRFCTTLEDKHEGYISSYFKAARFLKRTDIALNELLRRAESFGKKSHLPYESLYYAYRSLDRDQDSLEALKTALDYHPREQDIIILAVKAHLYAGLIDEAHSVFNTYKQNLSDITQHILSAALAKHKGDWEQEEIFYKSVLEKQPLNYDIIEDQTTLLGKHYGEAKAVSFIESRLALNPCDRYLLFLKASRLSDKSLEDQEAFAREIITIHPRDVEAHNRLANLLLVQRKFHEANTLLENALSIDPNNISTLTICGDYFYQCEDIEKATAYFQKIIRLQVDADSVFSRLIQCGNTLEKKRQHLEFILSEIMRQTSYGNGILEYREVAREIIPDEELLEFLKFAVEQRPDLWHAWAALAMHLVTMNKMQEALSTIDSAIAKFPLLPRLFLEKANIHFINQEFNQAENALQEANKLSPQWVLAITRLSDIYEAQNRYDEALVIIEKALHHSPTNPSLLGYAADFCRLKKKHRKALEYLKKAIEEDYQYEWAWDRYHEIAQRMELPKASEELCNNLLTRSPYSALLWRKLAQYTLEPSEKLTILEKALNLLPKDEELNLQLCSYYFEQHQIDNIQNLVAHEKWQSKPPASLLGYQAWVDSEHQYFDRAIERMQKVVVLHPNYYDGWRLLSRWSLLKKNYKNAIKYIDTCVRLRPHVPETLTLAAETYLEVKDKHLKIDTNRIGEYLRKAVFLQPRNFYNGQTWLDYLLDIEDLAGLCEAHEVLQETRENPYYWARFLQHALLEKDEDLAFDYFDKIIRCKENNSWIFHSSYKKLMTYGFKERVYETLAAAIKNTDTNPIVGELWTSYCFDTEKKHNKIMQYLDHMEEGSKVWFAALETVFTPKHYNKTTAKIIKYFKEILKKHPRTWCLIVFYYAHKDQWKDLCVWAGNQWRNSENNAWAVYFCGLAFRETGNWKRAQQINLFANILPEDDFYDRILLWKNFDALVQNGDPLNANELARIRIQEMWEVEQYTFELILGLYAIQNEGSLAAAEPQLISAINRAKSGRTDILAHPIAKAVKKSTTELVIKRVQGGPLKRWRWRIKLFHLL